MATGNGAGGFDWITEIVGYADKLDVPFWWLVLAIVVIILAIRSPALLVATLTFFSENKRIDLDAEHKTAQIEAKLERMREKRERRALASPEKRRKQ